jgi:hypothetical protein
MIKRIKRFFTELEWSEPSTKRGAVWLVVAIIGLPAWWLGKDVDGIILLAGAVAGGLGGLPDRQIDEDDRA